MAAKLAYRRKAKKKMRTPSKKNKQRNVWSVQSLAMQLQKVAQRGAINTWGGGIGLAQKSKQRMLLPLNILNLCIRTKQAVAH